MLRSMILGAAALASTAGALAPTAAEARHYRYDDRYYGSRYDREYRDYGYRNYDRRYYGRDRRYYRGRGCDNSGGAIVGAIAGGLLGRTIDTRGNRTVGTLGGALLGGLAGHAIDKSDNPRYCRR